MKEGAERARSHKDLEVRRRSMELVRQIYQLTDGFPKKEEYRLTSQLIRSVISVPANIAEGNARSSRMDYAHFVSIARGSAVVLDTLLLLAKSLAYVRAETIAPLIREAEELGFMLHGLREKLTHP